MNSLFFKFKQVRIFNVIVFLVTITKSQFTLTNNLQL